MIEPKMSKQIRLQYEDEFWFTIENVNVDDGYPGLSISYWENKSGLEVRQSYITMDLALIPNLVEAIQEMKPQQQENN